MHQNLAHVVKVKDVPAVAAGLTVVDIDYDNVDGAFSVLWVEEFAATVTVAAGTPSLQVFHADVSDYSDEEEITDLTNLIVAGMASKKVYIELVRPTKRYIRFRQNRAGAGNSIQIAGGAIIAQHKNKSPIVDSTIYSTDIATAPSS
jgi:hypothetical protein